MEMKLHLGCGTKKLPGWINIDAVETCQPDLLHDLQQPLPYADLIVDEITAHSLLEHFDKYMRYCVFSDWARVLKVGGKIEIVVPDFKKLLFRFFKFRFDDFVDTLFAENMWESELYIGHFGNHKWGYSQDTLKAFVAQFGIETVEIKTKSLNIHMIGRKVRHVSAEEMSKWVIESHNNKFGAHGYKLTYDQIKTKIKEFEKGSK